MERLNTEQQNSDLPHNTTVRLSEQAVADVTYEDLYESFALRTEDDLYAAVHTLLHGPAVPTGSYVDRGQVTRPTEEACAPQRECEPRDTAKRFTAA